MGVPRSWSLADFGCIIDGVRVSEYTDGDAVALSLADDDCVMTQGHNGAVCFSYKPGGGAELTLTLLQSSADNTRLAAKVDAILAARRGSLAISVVDGRGDTKFSGQGVPKKRPDIKAATEVGSTEWTFLVAVGAYNVAGNEEA